MIKNITFDFGQVLIRWDPTYITSHYVHNEDDRKLVEEVVFDRLYWAKLDAGTITDEEAVEAMQKRLPERLQEQAKECYFNWYKHAPEIDGMLGLIKKLKARGLRIFVLSNIGKMFVPHKDEFAPLREAEKCIFSSVVGHVKPNRDMFEYFLSACSIKAEETLFIDDNADNIEGARRCNIEAYRFDGDEKKLEEYLFRLLDEQGSI